MVVHLYDQAVKMKKSWELAQKYDWININCSIDNEPRTIEEIHEDIFKQVGKIL